MLRLVALVVVAIGTAACHRLSPTEKLLIGSWSQRYHSIDSIDYVTFEPDHTFWVMVSGAETWLECWGTWHLEGADIVRDFTFPELPPGEERLFPDLAASYAKRPRHTSDSIVALSQTTLKLKITFKSDWGFMEYDRTDRPQKPKPLYSSDATHLTRRWSERLAALVPSSK